MNEVWKDIIGYEGFYQVSNLGRVKSLDRKIAYSNGKIEHRFHNILPQVNNEQGYLYVRLSKNGCQKRVRVHRLVAEAFLDNPKHLSEVNHKDENKTNNCVNNLEWCSHKVNCNYGTRNNRIAHKNTNGKCSKKVIQKDLNGHTINVWPSMHEAQRHGFDYRKISKCCLGQQRTHKGYIWEFSL